MMLPKQLLIVLYLFLVPQAAMAAFPQDFSDVVWGGEPNISGWPETSQLQASVNGGTIYLNHSKKDSWPISSRFAASERINANCWGFVKINGVWHAGTWEYLRVGLTTRNTSTFGGRGHFRGPIGEFTPQVGEIYGFMVAGVSRDSLVGNNVAERTNVVLWRWGVGEVPYSTEPEPESAPMISPVIDMLLEDGEE